MSNFDFLKEKWSDLSKLGELAEKYVYSDPNASMMKQGMLAETMVRYMLAYDGIEEPEYDNTNAKRISLLRKNDLLPNEINNTLYILRKDRNDATHNGADEQTRALNNLKLLYDLCVWYMQIYGDYNFKAKDYVTPINCEISISELEKENKELEDRNKALELEIINIQKNGKANNDRKDKAYRKATSLNLTEEQTREIIDKQLVSVGWEADTNNIRYSKGTRPSKGRYLAIAEWPTDSKKGNGGFADYALFIGEKLVGIIEAKRKNKDVSSVLDYQCKDYAKYIKNEHEKYIIGDFRGYKVPFLFSTNGRKYIEQYKEKSGIWFLDTRESFNIPKALRGWPKPSEIEQDLSIDIKKADEQLLATGYEILQDPNGLNLRYYQIEAIKTLEEKLSHKQDRGEYADKYLIAMATGTGKTRTILGMIYRFLTAKRFKRILYLVDRNALGEQTFDTFKEVKLEQLMTLDKLYDIKGLNDKEYEKDTRVHIATVQSLVRRILYNDSDKSFGISDYDLIVIDEAHRGYLLDREMSVAEFQYRNQDDFISKYKSVIDYFDAVKIALTATPALHTTQIFGAPIYSYDYTRAVIDGYLVDHDAPHIITTKLSNDGITLEANSEVYVYNGQTNEVDSATIEDEIHFEVEQFNKRIVVDSFNKVVLHEIFKNIDPNEKGKTLIFAVDDSHADKIVMILKEYYASLGVSEECIMKITGSIANGNQDKIKEAIRKFKNEEFPSIVVTVDLLTTGIDVEEIVNLVFLRRVRSRILYEQMLGRATRLCPSIDKDHFEIYDAVGVYDALLPVSAMRPIAVNPKATFKELIGGFDSISDTDSQQILLNEIIAKANRIKNKMPYEYKEQFKSLANGSSIEDTLSDMKSKSIDEAIGIVRERESAFSYVRRAPKQVSKFISYAKDEVISHEKGYGNSTKPEDYLKEFREFVNENMDKIMALEIIATRPKELTRKSLKELKLELEKHNFREEWLKSAYNDMTNQDIAVDIISFIRQKSIGDAIISKDERIHNAIEKTKKAHPNLSKIQINWLNKIEKHLKKEVVLDKELFESNLFKKSGGYNAINKAFNNKLDDFIDEINENMYSAS